METLKKLCRWMVCIAGISISTYWVTMCTAYFVADTWLFNKIHQVHYINLINLVLWLSSPLCVIGLECDFWLKFIGGKDPNKLKKEPLTSIYRLKWMLVRVFIWIMVAFLIVYCHEVLFDSFTDATMLYANSVCIGVWMSIVNILLFMMVYLENLKMTWDKLYAQR